MTPLPPLCVITKWILTFFGQVKNDNTYYRFQTPYYWPSKNWAPENTDYAVYLCKRTMQNKARLELADYEAENLARLQKMFSRKWEYIFMQAGKNHVLVWKQIIRRQGGRHLKLWPEWVRIARSGRLESVPAGTKVVQNSKT